MGEGCFFDDFVDARGEDESYILFFLLVNGTQFRNWRRTNVGIAIRKHKFIRHNTLYFAPWTLARR